MSLIKQLWLAIAFALVFALAGSLLVGTLSGRHYLEQQLSVKNVDNANSLALSLSQMPKDPVTVELQIAAQFDAGHYRLIRLDSPTGAPLVVRENNAAGNEVPDWFMRLLPISVPPGVAQVQDGWHQYGMLTVESHTRYLYVALWHGTLQLLAWFLLGSVATGIVGSLVLRHITRPLRLLVEQADAISERRFITTPEPKTTEFRSVVRAMNALSHRVSAMLADESQRLEALRRQTQYDALTGLLNREQFFRLLDTALSRDDSSAGGSLLLTRVEDLAHLNQHLGRGDVDRLLGEIGQSLQRFAARNANWEAGRLNGSDFALLASGESDASALASQLHLDLQQLRQRWETQHRLVLALPIAASDYHANEARGRLMARIDGALATAEQNTETPFVAVCAEDASERTDRHAWRDAIQTALAQPPGLSLAFQPVRNAQGALLHREAPARLHLDGEWRNAGYFMPWAVRNGLMPTLDEAVLVAALQHIAVDGMPTAINVSPQSLGSAAFRDTLLGHLQRRPELAGKLWIEVPESGVLKLLAEFRALCADLKPLGCRIGIEHVGRQFSRIADLHQLGLDYIKVDASLVRDIDSDAGNQSFLRGLCVIGHTIGLRVIAEGVHNAAEATVLVDLGLDGMSGPGVAGEGVATEAPSMPPAAPGGPTSRGG